MSFVSNLFFSVEEVGACLELSFSRQGSQVSSFLVAFEGAAGVKGEFKHFHWIFLIFPLHHD